MLTSVQNPLVKQMRRLHRAKERREENLYLLEGTNLLEAAVKVNCLLVTICCTPAWQESHPELWKIASQRAERAEIVTPEVLKATTTTVNPDGVVATALRQPVKQIPDQISLGLVLERLQDPGNLGTIIRTSVATDVDALWLSEDSVELDNPKVLRASVGEWFNLPMMASPDLKTVINKNKSQGVQVVATLPQASKTYWEIDFNLPTLILLGNEKAGLTEDLAALADQEVRIPLNANVESLNVAIASALLLYEAQRQRFIK